jgi:methyl-accepting chemotaxis protein
MNFNIRQKLLYGFGIVLVALVTVGGFGYTQISQLEKTIGDSQAEEAFAGRAQSALWELRYGFPQFLVLTDPESRKKIIDAEPRLYKLLEDNLKAYAGASGLTPVQLEALKKTTDAWNAYKERRAPWFQLIAENKPEEAAAFRAQYTTPLGAATVKSMAELIDITEKEDSKQRETLVKVADQNKLLMLILVAVAAVIGLTAAVLVVRSMTNPIAQLQVALGKLSAGDYSARAKLAGKDELGQVGNALDKLLDERLEGLNKQAKESEQISNSVVEIMQAVGQVATNKDLSIRIPVTEDVTGAIGDAMNMLTSETAKVLGSVTDVSSAVSKASHLVKQSSDTAMTSATQGQSEVEAAARELSQAASTLNQLAQMAQKANESAELSVRTTRQALTTVDKTVSGINESRDLIRETEKRIKRLGERSQEITQVVGLINSIAERTGILALNASMQATAAGEAGRGFAIVADEVKRLSENAREATREISTLVSSIQSETSETVLAMNNAITQVVDVSRLADQAGSEMRGTQQATDDLATNVRNIAATAIEQARSGQSLQTRALSIQQTSRDTTRQLTQQNEETSKLVAYAQTLMHQVGVFKLPAGRVAS